jgi:hypothetical protein
VFRRWDALLLLAELFGVVGGAGFAADGCEVIFGVRRNRLTSQSNMALSPVSPRPQLRSRRGSS